MLVRKDDGSTLETSFYVCHCWSHSEWEDFWVTQFLKHLPDMMNPVHDEVVWCYGEWQPGYDLMKSVTSVEGLPNMEDRRGDKRRLVTVDDLMSETDERVTKLFTKGSHHRNMSVMYIVQNLFGKNKEQLTINLNSHYVVVFKNTRDASQITHLAKQMYPGKLRYLQEAFKDATSLPHGYLLIYLRQETPDHLRLRTHVFTDQLQVVYVHKQKRRKKKKKKNVYQSEEEHAFVKVAE